VQAFLPTPAPCRASVTIDSRRYTMCDVQLLSGLYATKCTNGLITSEISERSRSAHLH
jgi:hypothetical protein